MDRTRHEHGFSLIEILVVMAIIGIASAFAVPMVGSAVSGARLRNESKAIANLVGLAKMRATSQFSRARVYVDVAARTYRVEVWDKTNATWVTEGSATTLPFGVNFGFGVLDTPPANTQPAIAMSGECSDDLGGNVANTSCIVFNSRGIPIDSLGAPQGGNAVYLTDGTGVRATTVTATPLVREWWSSADAPGWIRQ